MKLGVYTAPFPTLTLDEVAAWAAESGFEMLELPCWPLDEVDGRDRTAHVDVANLTEREARELRAKLEHLGLGIAGLGYFANPLHPDLDRRAAMTEHLLKVFRAAELLGVATVGTFAGRDPSLPTEPALESFAQVWPELARRAAEHGVRVAIENCPMTAYAEDQWPGGANVASTPYMWRRMFEIVPDANFGLLFDPSHLVLQEIDHVRALREFEDRVFHVHAKDESIDPEQRYLHGAFDLGRHWHVPGVAGTGDIDWGRFVGELHTAGYEGTVSVELEDPSFEFREPQVEWRKRGLLIGRDVLRPFVK